MPESDFNQLHQTKKDVIKSNNMAPPDSQMFQRRVNIGQIFNSKEPAIVDEQARESSRHGSG